MMGTNSILEVKNSFGTVFHINDLVGHEGQGEGVATIKSFKMSETNLPEIVAVTTKGEVHIDFLKQIRL